MAFAQAPGWPFAGFFAVTPSIRGGMILSLDRSPRVATLGFTVTLSARVPESGACFPNFPAQRPLTLWQPLTFVIRTRL